MKNLKSFFEQILRIRMVEETIAERYSEQEMRCPVHLSIGQEAIAAGACSAVTTNDYAMSGHRSHAHYLAKGGSLKAMIAEIYGKSTGCCEGRGGSMHLIDRSAGFLGAVPIVGSTIPIAVGTALTSQLDHKETVTLAFFGEGATEEGVFHESMNFASLRNLPVIFICENNLYSVYTSMEPRQPMHREVNLQAIGHGVEAHQADGNDVEEVYRLVTAASLKARAGDGPTFLEFKTYRWREHCGPGYDNHIGYRSPEEFEGWKTLCPLDRLRRRLKAENLLTETLEENLRQKIRAEIEDAFAFARSSPFPDSSTMTQYLFA
ncbi:MAG TPA: thiamine pyrophosphate-dependent dehydrogenase E1 component subunit alpha [Chthoniobacterales bacterium]|nr:thiamine pyrophosphate-dependent dehydrogenase E1 component subunit alpha [Chthoniobacterales bacterium]